MNNNFYYTKSLSNIKIIDSRAVIRGYVAISNPLNNKASFTWGISGLVQDLPVEEPSVFVTPMKGQVKVQLLRSFVVCPSNYFVH